MQEIGLNTSSPASLYFWRQCFPVFSRPVGGHGCRDLRVQRQGGVKRSEVGLPLMVSFTFSALFLKGCKQMGSRSSFCLARSSVQQICVQILGLPAWLSAALSGWSVLPYIGSCPYVGQQTCPWGNHPKTGLLTLSLQC